MCTHEYVQTVSATAQQVYCEFRGLTWQQHEQEKGHEVLKPDKAWDSTFNTLKFNDDNGNFYRALPFKSFTAQGVCKSDTNNNKITHTHTDTQVFVFVSSSVCALLARLYVVAVCFRGTTAWRESMMQQGFSPSCSRHAPLWSIQKVCKGMHLGDWGGEFLSFHELSDIDQLEFVQYKPCAMKSHGVLCPVIDWIAFVCLTVCSMQRKGQFMNV